MAIYHLHADVVRRSRGHSAVAASAYAAGANLYDERAHKTQAYGRKRGVFHAEIIAPENAPEWVFDRKELWNRAELAEKRVDAQTARVFVLALPHELTDEQNIDLVRNYAQEMFVSGGMVVDIGLHRADKNGDQRNDHAHLVVTMRELDGDGFAGTKNREWNRKEKLEYWRGQWAVYQNNALEEAGFDIRVDHRTLLAQGIDREATVHLGKDATFIERHGGETELGNINREIEAHNHKLDELVSELAVLDAEITQELDNAFLPDVPELEAMGPEPEEMEPEEMEPLLPAVSWAEQKQQAQSPFTSEVTQEFTNQLRSGGEIHESGLGKNWWDRTLAGFESVYYNVRETVKEYWRRYVVDRFRDRDDPDRGQEPER
jgi:hypothetical protein